METYKKRSVDLMREVLALGGMSYAQVASKVIRNGKPMFRQSVFRMINSGSTSVATLLEIIDILGLELEIKRRDVG